MKTIFNNIYLTAYNHFVYKYDYNKDSLKNVRLNLAASSTKLCISGFTVFLFGWIYLAIYDIEAPKKIPPLMWLIVSIIYLLLYLYFQKYNNLNELYDSYLDFSESKRKKWKVITVLFFAICILSGFLPFLRKI